MCAIGTGKGNYRVNRTVVRAVDSGASLRCYDFTVNGMSPSVAWTPAIVLTDQCSL